MKKEYVNPEIEIVSLDYSDVIATSGLESAPDTDGDGWGGINGN